MRGSQGPARGLAGGESTQGCMHSLSNQYVSATAGRRRMLVGLRGENDDDDDIVQTHAQRPVQRDKGTTI